MEPLSPEPLRVVLFDLDNTLFDHYHSLRSAISAIQKKYASLSEKKLEELVGTYNTALQQAYDEYLDKKITYAETEAKKIQLFFNRYGLPQPSADEVQEFRAIYKPVYRENRRATPGSIETLARLREHGYHLAIITNGQIEDQQAKAEAIGVRHLVHRIITSEEVGYRKPDSRIFQFALEKLSAPRHTTYMVGDDADSDIKGALDSQLSAIMYAPMAQTSQMNEVPIIRHMSQLLGHLGIAAHQFKLCFTPTSSQLIIEGIGIDLVTEPRHCLIISKETVRAHVQHLGLVLVHSAKEHYIAAMSHLKEMIRTIAKAASAIDETRIQLSFPDQSQEGVTGGSLNCHILERDHSVFAEYVSLALDANPETQATLRRVAELLQGHCNDLMRDYPRAAIRQLRAATLILAEAAGIREDTIVLVEDIDGQVGTGGQKLGIIREPIVPSNVWHNQMSCTFEQRTGGLAESRH
ncbi:HAD-like domain-containing protein [Thelonectria olida]|uniref:HAD-like domain-containing protein n=1 Tax=Thelonectria olida TaxID=1576542 RepID=A0A9P9AJX5_9HYPO|nr:HAD-like domain-containing protein [Thelonectria olida]